MQAKNCQANKLCHHSITRIMYLALVGFFVTTGLVITIYSQSVLPANATIGELPFGGPIVADIYTPTPTLSGVCPAHTVVLDYSGNVPKLIGVSIPNFFNSPAGLTFDYGNLYTPGVQTLGEHDFIPLITCGGFPYPVFNIFFNPNYAKFQVGTGLIPGY